MSHTGSLATKDVLLEAMLRQAGAVRTRTGLQMLDAAKVLIDQPHPAGPRVGIITNSGGTGVELADLLVDEGFTLPDWTADLRVRLQESLGPAVSGQTPRFSAERSRLDGHPAEEWPGRGYPVAVRRTRRSIRPVVVGGADTEDGFRRSRADR